MIALGYDAAAKSAAVAQWRSSHEITATIVLSPSKFDFELPDAEFIDWPEIIMYRTFYRLLQEIDHHTLVVVNECLRTQNRYDLTYNCIRHFVNQAGHVLVFQWLPIIESEQDFMILFDFGTRSQWKRERFDPELLTEAEITICAQRVTLEPQTIAADAALHDRYQREKRKLFDGLGSKDPHTIPRNLHLIGGKARAECADAFGWHLARNQRYKLERLQTYKEPSYPNAPYLALDLPHNHGDLIDALSLAQQPRLPVVVTDLRVDQWYLERYLQWQKRLSDAYAEIPQT